ncbi:bifunctional peptidase and arginyl-hydroxylase JMJD5-like isoform X1 [Topomyia yanbarensis]|uniref:bifunctional peptidase and arginyl-hydroxylase JMJD5-like isoform X1 n=2 Tax=Topomyia yanbarensis TaxID=2498891 RepID=UPI00273B3B52|nr:bifunctional peptidase and arginyl-hydroxylase JMJD5-like isoform X1 [Topomyia yanbarensis]
MNILKELRILFPSKDFFSTISAINSKKLFRDVIRIVIEPFVSEDFDVERLIASEFARCNLLRIGIVYDLVHGSLHTGEWHAVPTEERELFTILSFLRIIYMVLYVRESNELLSDATYIADIGLMLGSRVFANPNQPDLCLLTEVATVLTEANGKHRNEPPLKRIKIDSDDNIHIQCDIPVLYCPTMEYFGTHHYDKQEPVLLRGVIDDWPAMQRWHDPNYLIELAGERTVPVEIGSQYSNEDWSQGLVKFKDFLFDNLGPPSSGDKPQNSGKRAYLAQHELFDQIPKLRSDIFVPDYIGRTDLSPRIKAWLGPAGTISPLHTDPCHNLLCQGFILFLY